MKNVEMKLVLTHLMKIQDRIFKVHCCIANKEIEIKKEVDILGGLKLDLSLTVDGRGDYIDELTFIDKAITNMLYAIVGTPDDEISDDVINTLCDEETEPEIRAERIMKLYGYAE